MRVGVTADEMVWNLKLAAAMCRIHYRRVAAPLPAADDIEGLAAYWKTYYTTAAGAGTVDEFIRHFEIVRSALQP